jgi:glutamine amidotransferase
MITIIDFGLGNAQAFANIYGRLGIPVVFAKKVDDLAGATHLILPGVGAFDWAMKQLNASGMRTELERLVLEEKRYVLGVCVGMQMMASRSDEGVAPGLGWFDAEVRRFDEFQVQPCIQLPHMGWNEVKPVHTRNLFQGMEGNPLFYFLHSYYFAPNNSADILASTHYGNGFASAICHDNIYGVQYHPEKSHGSGVLLLKNFAGLSDA